MLTVRFDSALKIKFYSIGTDSFEEISNTTELNNNFIKKHDGLFFPRQGYKLLIERQTAA